MTEFGFDTLPVAEIYKQASDCCRNYSDLTMRVRTLTQQVLITFVLGIGLFFAHVKEAKHIPFVLYLAGSALVLFSGALLVLNLHYSKAFTRIRASLVRIERDRGLHGPWTAHEEGQPKVLRYLAWYAPYLVLGVAGVVLLMAAWRWS